MLRLFGGRRRKQITAGRELRAYRQSLVAQTDTIDRLLGEVDEAIDALRRRALEPDEAVLQLTTFEESLDGGADELREMLAPEELHGLHMEYEANLERALRGIVTVQRGCALTRQRHRPADDDEPQTNYRRGHLNVVHARLRMQEIVDVLTTWEPGKPAEANLVARLNRDEA